MKVRKTTRQSEQDLQALKHELSPEKQIQNLKNTLDKVKGFLIEKGLFAECVGYINTQKPRA